MSVPIGTLTGYMSEVTQALVDLLETNKGTLGIRLVFDGDQRLIPETPCIAVVAGRKDRELYEAGIRTKVDFQVGLMIYHNRLQDVQKSQREVMQLEEAVEELLHEHANQTLGGLVIFGMVTATEPGYADRAGTILRTSRMTWEAQSRQQLPTS